MASVQVFSTGTIPGVTVTGTGVYTSLVTAVGSGGRLTYRAKFTETVASLTGTLVVEISHSTDQEFAAAAAEWDTYDLITLPAISGTMIVPIKLTSMPAGTRVRLSYTNATGTAIVKAWVRTS